MITVNKDFMDFTEKEMTNQLIRFSKESLKEDEAKVMAKDIVKKIDWNNSALMHKGLSWIAKNYLEQVSKHNKEIH